VGHSIQTPETPSNTRRFAAAAAISLLALVLAVWFPALETQLVSDDFSLVEIGFSDALGYFHRTFGFGRNEYRPVTALSFAIDRAVWRGWISGYHLTNILLHGGVTVLLFLILQVLTRDRVLSGAAAVLFAIHPVTHSRVAWLAARDGSVSGFFLFGSLWCYVLYRRQGHRLLYALALLASALALLAYEGAIVLPLIVLVIELLFLSEGTLRQRLAASLRAGAPFGILGLAYVAVWHTAFSGSVGGYDLADGVAGAAANYGRLWYTLFFGHRRLAFGIAYALLLAAGLARLRAWRSTAAFGVAVIVIGFVPFAVISGFAHRFAYVSAAGFAVLLAGCITAGARGDRRFWRAASVTLAVVIGSYYLTEVRRALADWVRAGEIAGGIPRLLREAQPDLPDGTLLLVRGVPHMHGRAMVFPTGLEAAVQREYRKLVYVREANEVDPAFVEQVRISRAPVYNVEYAEGRVRVDVNSPAPRAASNRER
jgi:hypothetical protein